MIKSRTTWLKISSDITLVSGEMTKRTRESILSDKFDNTNCCIKVFLLPRFNLNRGAVLRNLSKFWHWDNLPPNWVKQTKTAQSMRRWYEKQTRYSKIQKVAQMDTVDRHEEDWNRLHCVFENLLNSRTVFQSSFLLFITFVIRECLGYIFVWHESVILSLTGNFSSP